MQEIKDDHLRCKIQTTENKISDIQKQSPGGVL